MTVKVDRPELQWPLFGANPARTQAHLAIDLRPPFRIAWTRGLGGLLEFPAIVWEGVADVWTAGVGSSVASAPQVVAGVVYAAGLGRRIGAWHWRTGKRLWTFGFSQYAPVSGNGGRLLVHGFSRIWALEPRRKS